VDAHREAGQQAGDCTRIRILFLQDERYVHESCCDSSGGPRVSPGYDDDLRPDLSEKARDTDKADRKARDRSPAREWALAVDAVQGKKNMLLASFGQHPCFKSAPSTHKYDANVWSCRPECVCDGQRWVEMTAGTSAGQHDYGSGLRHALPFPPVPPARQTL
jgi:hypothetical protein